MRILVFTEGTIIMHSAARGHSREEIVQQIEDNIQGVNDFSSHIPIGETVKKLKSWHQQGAEIMYLTSRTTADEIASVAQVLKRHHFPSGRLYHRLREEQYHEVAERVRPDILIEDDCESIGGEVETVSHHLDPKAKIGVIIVKEFGGIDHLPDELEKLSALA